VNIFALDVSSSMGPYLKVAKEFIKGQFKERDLIILFAHSIVGFRNLESIDALLGVGFGCSVREVVGYVNLTNRRQPIDRVFLITDGLFADGYMLSEFEVPYILVNIEDGTLNFPYLTRR